MAMNRRMLGCEKLPSMLTSLRISAHTCDRKTTVREPGLRTTSGQGAGSRHPCQKCQGSPPACSSSLRKPAVAVLNACGNVHTYAS
eukprot:356940-Chlamydomonas_euryale.AAC.4